MRSWMIAFISGVALFWLTPASWSLNLAILLLILLSAILFRIRCKKCIFCNVFNAQLLLFLCCGIIGFVLAQQQHQLLSFTQKQLPKHTESVEITATINSPPVQYQKFISFRVKLDSINGKPLSLIWKPTLQLNWYSRNQSTVQIPKFGEVWKLSVRLKPLHGLRNPHSFDYERWGWSKRIIARGYVVNKHPQLRLTKESSVLQQWRRLILQNVQAMPTNAHLAASLLIGDKSQLEGSFREQLQQSGLAHLLAISGLHIGMVALIGFWTGSRIWKLSSRLCSLLPAVDAAVISSVVLATVYALLSGWAIPAQRALLMLVVISINHLFRLHWRLLDVLLVALTLMVLVNPVSILDSGGWLSFGAVFVIAGLLRFQQKQNHNTPSKLSRSIKNWIIFSALLWISLLPLAILVFGKIATLGLLANLFAIPLMSFLIMPLLLAGALLVLFSVNLAGYFWLLADYALSLIVEISRILSEAGIAVMQPLQIGLLSSILLVFWLLPRALIPSKLLLVLSLLVTSCLFFMPATPTISARLILFDVGQGLAVLWEDYTVPRKPIRILFDTAYGNETYQISDSSWLPYFSATNINQIEALFVSHNDADHSGGLRVFNHQLKAKVIYRGQKIASKLASRNCHQFDRLEFGSTSLKILTAYPEQVLVFQKDNNRSCIIQLNFAKSKILLPGDIELNAELKLLQKGILEKVDILIAPHHGSKTSSSEKFVEVVKPEYVLFSTGFLNRYQFPKKEVERRYLKQQSKVLNSATVGAIECLWDIDKKFMGCSGIRDQDWGRWHWQQSR